MVDRKSKYYKPKSFIFLIFLLEKKDQIHNILLAILIPDLVLDQKTLTKKNRTKKKAEKQKKTLVPPLLYQRNTPIPDPKVVPMTDQMTKRRREITKNLKSRKY